VKQPEDPDVDDDWDPTGYYRRKAERNEEMIPVLGWFFAGSIVMIGLMFIYQEIIMFGDLTTLATGVVIGLVLVQLYPPSARVGVWIINKSKALMKKIRG